MAKTKTVKAPKKAPKTSTKPSREDELKDLVRELKANLKKAESQADKWKQRAKAHGAAVTDARAKVAKLEKRVAKAGREARPKVRRAVERVKDISAETIAVTATAMDPSDSTAPNATWTVTRLRAEARTRGVTGYSRMSKDQLLAALA